LFAFDSPCYHANGPLGNGPIEDVENITCVRCPWHNFLVALDTGEEVIREMLPPQFSEDGVFHTPTYPLTPSALGKAKRTGQLVQRTHRAYFDPESNEVMVEILNDGRPRRSDAGATHPQRGAMSLQVWSIQLEEMAAAEEAKLQLATKTAEN